MSRIKFNVSGQQLLQHSIKDFLGKQHPTIPSEELREASEFWKEKHQRLVKPIPRPPTPPTSFSLEQYQTPVKDQKGRGVCWAFAAIGALEAAYKRKYGITLDLSEQYAVQMHRLSGMVNDYMTTTQCENASSLWGCWGSAAMISELIRYAIPEEKYAPYKSQEEMNDLSNTINGCIMTWDNTTQEMMDAFEFDECNVPIAARLNAQYQARGWGVIGNITTDQMENVILNNHEVAIDVDVSMWTQNTQTGILDYNPNGAGNGGHVVLVYGFDKTDQYFIAKNSWGQNDQPVLKISYDYINKVTAQWFTGYYITDVEDQKMDPQKKAKWIGFWNMDHDGWVGKLTVRRFTNGLQGENDPTKVGTYYRDGKKYDVNGFFSEDGQALTFFLPDNEGKLVPGALYCGQQFDICNYSWQPSMSAGKTVWNYTGFGVVTNRSAIAPVPSAAFDKNKWLGTWKMNHDGWQGTLTITNIQQDQYGLFTDVGGTYLTHDGITLNISGYLNPLHNHIIELMIPFSDDNHQPFELFYHTRESNVFSGTTVWGGRQFGIFGQKA